jgi:hypothetical protein
MNRNQAKLLAPIICAFAAGSVIEWRKKGTSNWINEPMGIEPNFERCIQEGIELRIAPKPPKVKEAKLALVLEGSATAIVTKGKWELMEKSPDFLKWISEPFKLLPSDKRAHARG